MNESEKTLESVDQATRIALIERLEKATGPSREIDAAIFKIVQPFSERFKSNPFGRGLGQMSWISADKATTHPLYTASIDAALTLVPEGYRTLHAGESIGGKWFWGLHMDAGHPNNPTTKDGISYAHQTDSRANLFADGASSPAIALCIAALKARPAELKG